MGDAILVLNAGSSSLKFSAFRVEPGAGDPLARGQVEGIGTAPRFVLRGPAGEVIEEQTLPADAPLDHAHALGVIVERCQTHLGGNRLVAVGHRVVHGGVKFAAALRASMMPYWPDWRNWCRSPRCTNRTTWRRCGPSAGAPHVPQVACFDTSFHRSQPEVAQRFGLPRRFLDEGVRRRTDSTACLTNTSHPFCRALTPMRPRAERSLHTSGTGRVCVRCAAGRVSPRP